MKKKFFAASWVRFFFDTWSDGNKRFKNSINISRTCFDRHKSFQINVVYRIQIEERVKQYNYVMKKMRKIFFAASRVRFFFYMRSDGNKQFFFSWPNVLFYLMIIWVYRCQVLVTWYQTDLDVCFMQQGTRFTEV